MTVEPTFQNVSSNVLAMKRSGIRELMDLASRIDNVIHLEVGEPNFPTPEHIIEAAYRGAMAGHTRYTANAGLISLRENLVEKLRTVNGIAASVDELVVTHGAVSGLMSAMMAVLNPGDEILLPDPGWPNWEMMALSIGAVPRRYRLEPTEGFVPDIERLKALIGPRTKVLLVNSPANPTGAVLSARTLEAMVEVARSHDLWLFSDECYDQLVYDVEHVSAKRFDTDDRVVSFFSFSKTYSMTGWRIGYAHVPPGLVSSMVKLQEPLLGCPNNVSQKAAEGALRGSQDAVEKMRRAYQERRDLVSGMLTSAGIAHHVPDGAFYLMLDVRTDSDSFARELLTESRVAVSPGTAFGTAHPSLIRVSLASSAEDLTAGITSIIKKTTEGSGTFSA